MKLRTNVVCAYACAAILGVTSSTVFAQDEASESDNDPELVEEQPEQDNISKALDSTATQWSFQFAWQGTEWKKDEVAVNPRPQGHDNFVQLRVVAPFAFEKFTLLPRLTLRHYENLETGKSGIGNTEVFRLIIPRKWDYLVSR